MPLKLKEEASSQRWVPTAAAGVLEFMWISVHMSPDGEALVSFLLPCDQCQ